MELLEFSPVSVVAPTAPAAPAALAALAALAPAALAALAAPLSAALAAATPAAPAPAALAPFPMVPTKKGVIDLTMHNGSEFAAALAAGEFTTLSTAILNLILRQIHLMKTLFRPWSPRPTLAATSPCRAVTITTLILSLAYALSCGQQF